MKNQKSKSRDIVEGHTLMGLPAFWVSVSQNLTPDDPAWKYRYDRAHASRARKWLAIAVQSERPFPGVEPDVEVLERWMAEVPLSKLLGRPIEPLALRARACFLSCAHGIPWAEAEERGAAGHPGAIRKAANNVSDSTRRALNFLNSISQSRYGFTATAEDDAWPPPTPSSAVQYNKGMRLYRQIVRWHRAQGVVDPAQASSESVQSASRKLRDSATDAAKRGAWTTMLTQLKAAITADFLPGFTLAHLEGLKPAYSMRRRPKAMSIPQKDVIAFWPEHWVAKADNTSRVDPTRGLLGFFNKKLGPARPANPSGFQCPRDNLNGDRAIRNRDCALRRYLGYWRPHEDADRKPEQLETYFSVERMSSWLHKMISSAAALTVHHTHEYWHVVYTARLYFGIKTVDFEEWVKEEYDLPTPGDSDRGRKAVKEAVSPTVFLQCAQAFAMYAAKSPAINAKHRSGHYFPRKGQELSIYLRCETGLRPENIARLQYHDIEPVDISFPVLFPDANGHGYHVVIPKDHMKQHKRRSRATGNSVAKKKPYYFRVVRSDSVKAIGEYLAAWKQADAVISGRTSELFLNVKAEPFDESHSFSNSYGAIRSRAAEMYARHTGNNLPLLDLYAHRHVIGEFLSRHVPGGSLKTWYLTHSTGKGSDREYGDDDAEFLRRCISEVLDGKPPVHEQEETRRHEQAKQELELMEREKETLHLQRLMTEQLTALQAQLARKDELLDQMRCRLTQKQSEQRDNSGQTGGQ